MPRPLDNTRHVPSGGVPPPGSAEGLPAVPDLGEVPHSDHPVSLAIQFATEQLRRPLESAERMAIVRIHNSYRRKHSGPEVKAALDSLLMQPFRLHLGDVPEMFPDYVQALTSALASVRYDHSLPGTSLRVGDRWLSRRALPFLGRATQLIATDPRLKNHLDTGLGRLHLYDPPRHAFVRPRTRHERCELWPPPLYSPRPKRAHDEALLVMSAAHMLIGVAAEERVGADFWRIMGETGSLRQSRLDPDDAAARDAALPRWFLPVRFSSRVKAPPFDIARGLLKRIDQMDVLALPLSGLETADKVLETTRDDHRRVIRLGVKALAAIEYPIPGLGSMLEHLETERGRVASPFP